MEIIYIFIALVFFGKLLLFVFKTLFSDNTPYPDISKKNISEIQKLADKYCWGDGVDRSTKVANYLLKHIVINGTNDEKKKALEYAEYSCGSIVGDLIKLARSIGFIYTGIGH